MDTCKEIPFEQLNTLQVSALPLLIPTLVSLFPQNFKVPHGQNYYMKGVFVSAPQVDVAEKVAARLPQLSKESGVNFTLVHELLPMKKVLSVPNHATAHIRASRINVLVIAAWDSKDINLLDTVRNNLNELGQIVIQGEKIIPESANVGYGNYSKRRVEHIGDCTQVHLDPEEIVSVAAGSKANAEALFGENYARLQKLKQEHDPDLVFFKWCPITPQA